MRVMKTMKTREPGWVCNYSDGTPETSRKQHQEQTGLNTDYKIKGETREIILHLQHLPTTRHGNTEGEA